MVLWWIGNILLLVVIAPVLVALLNRVLAALERIRGASDDILAGGVRSPVSWTAYPRRWPRPTGPCAPSPPARSGTPARWPSCSPADNKEAELMPAVAGVTLVIAALIIAAAALGLLRVILHLRAVASTLDGVIAGVGVVADRTAPCPTDCRRSTPA